MLLCLESKCQEWVRAPNSRVTEIKCGKCNTMICFKCKMKGHSGHPCHHIEPVIPPWQLDKNYQDCPMCHCPIEKIGGCNHMRCIIPTCKYEWCFQCRGEYERNHYRQGNPTGCVRFPNEMPRNPTMIPYHGHNHHNDIQNRRDLNLEYRYEVLHQNGYNQPRHGWFREFCSWIKMLSYSILVSYIILLMIPLLFLFCIFVICNPCMYPIDNKIDALFIYPFYPIRGRIASNLFMWTCMIAELVFVIQSDTFFSLYLFLIAPWYHLLIVGIRMCDLLLSNRPI